MELGRITVYLSPQVREEYQDVLTRPSILAKNPQLAGHGTDGRSFLWKLRPSGEREFQQLFDRFQIPRYYLDRPWDIPPEPAAGTDQKPQSETIHDHDNEDEPTGQHDGDVIDIATRLKGFSEPAGSSPIVDLPSPGGPDPDNTDPDDTGLDDTGA